MKPRMTLPRLRVRELLFLVIYAALIGQAFVLSLFPSTVSYPSEFEGYVWVRKADYPDYPTGPDGLYHYSLRKDGGHEYMTTRVPGIWSFEWYDPGDSALVLVLVPKGYFTALGTGQRMLMFDDPNGRGSGEGTQEDQR